MSHDERSRAVDRLKSALTHVAPPYFAPAGPNIDALYIERVFAYELYHQMRLVFGDGWYVHGEFRKGLRLVPELGSNGTLTPDLVVHDPGTLDGNLIAIEIKAAPTVTAGEILADFAKLEFFTRPSAHIDPGLNFSMGIMLLVNSSFPQVYRRASPDTQQALSHLAHAAPRVVIWNIATPIPNKDSNSGHLNPDCLTLFRADWDGWRSAASIRSG